MEVGSVSYDLHVKAPLAGMGHHGLGGTPRHVEGKEIIGEELPLGQSTRGVEGGHDVTALVGESAHLGAAPRREGFGGDDAREKAGHIGVSGVTGGGGHPHGGDLVVPFLQNAPQVADDGGEVLDVGKDRVALAQAAGSLGDGEGGLAVGDDGDLTPLVGGTGRR